MCPVTDNDAYQSQEMRRSHSDSVVEKDGFSIWRGRRIRKDVGSWPCDTIELEVCLHSQFISQALWRRVSELMGRGRKPKYVQRRVALIQALVITDT
jgi:hypothetical protein